MASLDDVAPCSLHRILDDAAATLQLAGIENAWLDAELMLARAADVSRIHVLMRDVALDAKARHAYASMVALRAARVPIAYILGTKEFYSLEFEVTPAVLIPRPETELVVEAALKVLASRPATRVLDIGTGSGAIALAIAANAPRAEITAIDISEAALVVARRNADRLKLTDRVSFRRVDCFAVRDEGPPLTSFDLIVANPPYIIDSAIPELQTEVSRWEPYVALAGGADGLDFYRRLTSALHLHLAANGRVIVEIGEGQGDAATRILSGAGCSVIEHLRDSAAIERVLIAAR